MTKARLSTWLMAGIVGAAACGPKDEGDGFREAVPSGDAVTIRVPDSGGSDGVLTRAVLGQRAGLYKVTRDVSRAVNGGTGVMLGILWVIVQLPPTTVQGDTRSWGPWHGDSLAPLEYRLDVTRDAQGEFDYVLNSRRRAGGDGAWTGIVNGHTHVGDGARGHIAFDFDAAHGLDADEHRAVGQMDAMFDTTQTPHSLDVMFANVSWLGERPVDATYHYDVEADGAGAFRFTTQGDVNHNGSALEDLQVLSHWKADGSGRSDATISGGDVPASVGRVIATECWDATFGRNYYTDSANIAPTEGNAADCAFSMALPAME